MTAAETLHDEDVFAVDQPSGNASRKVRLDQVTAYVDTKIVTPAVSAEEVRAKNAEENLVNAVAKLQTKKANIVSIPYTKTLAEAAVSDVLKAIAFNTSSTPGALPSAGNIVFSDGSRIDADVSGDMKYTSAASVITDIYIGGVWQVSSLGTGTVAVTGVSNNSGGAWENGTWIAGNTYLDLPDVNNKLVSEIVRANAADTANAAAAFSAQTSADTANAALLHKANIIPGSHIDWDFHTTPVPAGRTLLFDTSKTPSLSGGSMPTSAAFITIDSDPDKMFGFFTDDDGATTLGGLFHIDRDVFVLDRPVWDGTAWVNNGKYELQYGINPGPMDYIGDSTLNGFDMLADISVEDIPARDLVDVENELKDSLSDDISENNRHRVFTTRATKELLANISTGFLVRARIDPFDWSIKPYSDWNAGTVDPQYVAEAEADLPGTSATDDIAITANGDIYTSDGTDWTKQNSAANTLAEGWLFAETSTRKGWYAFGGEWNQLDFSVDWTEIVDGASIGYNGEHIFVKDGGVGTAQLQTGAATDAVIGDRTLADENADPALIPAGAKKLTGWLQGFRNNLKWLLDKLVKKVDGIEAGPDNNIDLTLEMTKAEHDALEDPPGSGLYPSLAGKTVTLKDVYPENSSNCPFPVGAIHLSVSPENPSTAWPGTEWEEWGTGRVPVAVDTSQTEFASAEMTGGEKTHTLTVDEMPSHSHGNGVTLNANILAGGGAGSWWNRTNTGGAGGNGAHNNLQPYITCYMWKRMV
ncbi:MAG: hypothetical protein LBK08_11670 [Treponema sp.]|jgi:hypothetical protein|nr:hypothetical protein [Treponema sp.]